MVLYSVLRTVNIDSGRNRIPPERETDSRICQSIATEA